MGYKYHDLFSLVKNTKGLCSDSRLIQPGECFFALNGLTHKGSKFISDAIKQGACYAVSDDPEFADQPKVLYVENVKEALEFCCQRFYNNLPKYRVAVTGTNGKSSIVSYCCQIMNLLGVPAASIGTLGVYVGNNEFKELALMAGLTSNDLISNYKILSRLKEVGVEFAALEASSIGLEQGRLAGIEFQATAFSSFSQDHLDYHSDLTKYMRAKLVLFSKNISKDAACYMTQQACQAILDLGLCLPKEVCHIIGDKKHSSIKITKHLADLDKQSIKFNYLGCDYSFNTEIVGKFQGYNLLLAIFLCSGCGFSLEKILPLIPKLVQVKGRLQKIDYNSKSVFIDYAHNPDALKTILQELKALKPQAKIITVFGCGGNRDNKKRPMMGSIACDFSDYVIVTDDNPRKEQPENIVKEIVAGITKNNYQIIHNRAHAIHTGLNMLNNYDILLIAGKGHEEYQLYSDRKIKFSDEDIVKQKIVTL